MNGDDVDLTAMVQQVRQLCDSCTDDDIRLDLQKTKSVEVTLNRIWDGQLLEKPTRKTDSQIPIVVVSDDEDQVPDTEILTLHEDVHVRTAYADTRTAEVDSNNATSPILSPANRFTSSFDLDGDALPSADELFSSITIDRRKRKRSEGPNNAVAFVDSQATDLSHKSRSLSSDKNPVTDLTDLDNFEFAMPSNTWDFLKEWEDDLASSQSSIPETGSQLSAVEDTTKGSSDLPSKERRAQQRKLQAEEKRRERQRLKEQKEAEKLRRKTLQQVNRLRSNRNESLKEIILHIDRNFAETKRGHLLMAVLAAKEVQVELTEPNNSYDITWSRKCVADWDTDSQQFTPREEMTIEEEPFVLVLLDADKICHLVKRQQLESRMEEVQLAVGQKQILLMIEGLDSYYKKHNLMKRRQFENAVLESIQQEEPVSSQESLRLASEGSSRANNRRSRTAADILSGPDKDEIEGSLTTLQIMQNVMLVPTSDAQDSVDWILCISTDIGNALYWKKSMNRKYKHFNSMQSGTDPEDVWFKMLQEVQLCTPAVAKAIIERYPSVYHLFHHYENLENVAQREDLLADLSVERNSLSQRHHKVNKAMSKKIYDIFTSDDPNRVIA